MDEDPQLFQQFKGHKDAITASHFSPNGKQVSNGIGNFPAHTLAPSAPATAFVSDFAYFLAHAHALSHAHTGGLLFPGPQPDAVEVPVP